MMRECGGCTLCCRLLPVRELGKGADQRCKYQRTMKGCAIYNSRIMPPSCQLWNCRWLVNDDTADLRRPDRSHYVVDIMPDFVTVTDNDTGAETKFEVIQIWIDPQYPDAHRDPALRAFLERQGKMGLVRYGNADGVVLVPPALNTAHEWAEVHSPVRSAQHSWGEIAETLAGLAEPAAEGN